MLRVAEFEASKQHCPRGNRSGKPLCWNFNPNSGCAAKGGECPFGLHRRMKRNGLHWTIQSKIARRGGFVGAKILTAPEIDGFIFSLRNAENDSWKAKKDPSIPNSNNATGGYTLIEKGESILPTWGIRKTIFQSRAAWARTLPPDYNIGIRSQC